MKRSTKDVIYVSPRDFKLATKGIKTATSRLGDKTDMYLPGDTPVLSENESPDRTRKIKIVSCYTKQLSEVTDAEAQSIGGYYILSHAIDFTNIYAGLGNNITPNTLLTIIRFEIKE